MKITSGQKFQFVHLKNELSTGSGKANRKKYLVWKKKSSLVIEIVYIPVVLSSEYYQLNKSIMTLPYFLEAMCQND